MITAEHGPWMWVTGGRGFLGRHISLAFARRGWRVGGLGRGAWPEAKRWGTSLWIEGDVRETTIEKLLTRTGSPAAVFHAAGTSSVGKAEADPHRSHRDSVESTRALLDVITHTSEDSVVLFPSSCAVYGDAGAVPLTEDRPPDPVSRYGREKIVSEDLLRDAAEDHGLRCGIIRYFSLYGPGLRKQVMWDLCIRAHAGESPLQLGGSGGESRDLLHIEDATRLAELVESHCREAPQGGVSIFNGGSGHVRTVSEIATLVTSLLPVRPRVTFSGRTRIGDPPHYRASIDRMLELGFSPVWTPENGIKDYVTWATKEIWGQG